MKDEYNIVDNDYWTLMDKDTVLYQNILDKIKTTSNNSHLTEFATYMVVFAIIFVIFGDGLVSDLIIFILGVVIGFILYKKKKISLPIGTKNITNLYVNTATVVKKWSENYVNGDLSHLCELSYNNGSYKSEDNISPIYKITEEQYEQMEDNSMVYIVKYTIKDTSSVIVLLRDEISELRV